MEKVNQLLTLLFGHICVPIIIFLQCCTVGNNIYYQSVVCSPLQATCTLLD